MNPLFAALQARQQEYANAMAGLNGMAGHNAKYGTGMEGMMMDPYGQQDIALMQQQHVQYSKRSMAF